MAYKITPTCALCGGVQHYLEEEAPAVCDLCGQPFDAFLGCPEGHHICHDCRQGIARQSMEDFCLQSEETAPHRLMIDLMKLPYTLMHGPEHHFLLPAALLTSLHNKIGNPEDLPAALEEANRRSLQVPGAACGHWGACGAAIGTGIFLSILKETGPLSEESWREVGGLTARGITVISQEGGPRCCKRDSFLALREAVSYCNEKLNAEFPIPDIDCEFYPNNRDCKGKRCPYFPHREK